MQFESGKRGTEEWNLVTGANQENQGCHGLLPEHEDVKAVSVRHCTATSAPRNYCPNCYAEQSHKDNVYSSAVGKQLKQKKSNSQAQHHLPALDLFWASSWEYSSPPSPGSRLRRECTRQIRAWCNWHSTGGHNEWNIWHDNIVPPPPPPPPLPSSRGSHKF